MNNLKENLEKIRSRVELACQAAGRDPSEVRILAVSKRHPVARIAALNDLGHTAFGENYMQEALEKIRQMEDREIDWHFIGPLQSNKTREVSAHFQWVQSADREKILRRLSGQRPEGMPPLNVCIQVNIDREPQKAGCMPEDTLALGRFCTELPGLRLRGLMAIPRIGSAGHDPAGSYGLMQDLYRELLGSGLAMDTLSMGMSADLEAAVRCGSTMVRIGTDLFGPRPV